MKEYQTNQRQVLLEVFSENRERKLTVEDIIDLLPEQKQISRSAIYRNVDKMVQDGLLDKTLIPGGRKTAYQFACCEKDCKRIHLRCEKCGKLTHLESENDESRLSELLAENGFKTDEHAVILGVCKDCK